MCGICGYIGIVDKAFLENMAEKMEHRGPDGRGFYINPKYSVGLGHQRLSIIDLSSAGKQPMCNEDGKVWLTYNGEIYNYRELKKTLLLKKHIFSSRTDAEVVIHAYEEWGIDCLSKFNGMFAFALWDENLQVLFAARDRLGIKPFYYTCKGTKFIFASEIKAILEWPHFDKAINYNSIDNYLTFRYTPGSSTIFKYISRLSPGHYLKFHRSNLEIRKYWELDFHTEEMRKTDDEYQNEFFELFQDSVKIRLMSDVPFGAYLSSGIDSNSIVALMSSAISGSVRTFSVGFGTKVDETKLARDSARYFNAEHYEINCKPENFDLLPKIIRHLEEPMGDAIIIPSYLLSHLASKHVKMVLTGEGADELLGGYFHQFALLKLHRLKNIIPKGVLSLLSKFISMSPVKMLDLFFNYPASMGKIGRERLSSLLLTLNSLGISYLSLISLFDRNDKKNLYTDKFRDLIGNNSSVENAIKRELNSNSESYFNKALSQELKNWLPDNILFKQDRLMMANSVEGRVPFLDHRLVEFAAHLPTEFKIRGSTNKFILRNTVSNMLPPNLAKRKKQAFYLPIEKDYENKFGELIKTYLSPERVKRRGLFDYGYIETIIKNSGRSTLICRKQLMALVILEIWFELFFANN